MSVASEPSGLQEAVDRSFRAQWGGRRFFIITAIVLFVLAVLSGFVLALASSWWKHKDDSALQILELSALGTSFVCLIGSALCAAEAVERAQREQGQHPDHVIQTAFALSLLTIALLLFFFFLCVAPLKQSGIRGEIGIARFILFLFCSIAWFAALVMSAAGVTKLLTRRSDVLEVNSTTEGTAVLLKHGYTSEIIKLSIAAICLAIIFVIALLIVGVSMILRS